jgi:hypothetical protein
MNPPARVPTTILLEIPMGTHAALGTTRGKVQEVAVAAVHTMTTTLMQPHNAVLVGAEPPVLEYQRRIPMLGMETRTNAAFAKAPVQITALTAMAQLPTDLLQTVLMMTAAQRLGLEMASRMVPTSLMVVTLPAMTAMVAMWPPIVRAPVKVRPR